MILWTVYTLLDIYASSRVANLRGPSCRKTCMPIIAVGTAKPSKRVGQCQKPRGLLGRFVLWTMNKRHSRVTDWGLQGIAVESDAKILDVGCGGGRTVSKLSAMAPAGIVHGIDYSTESVAAARRFNREAIDQGRVVIEEGSVLALPYAAGTFDLVTAVETHFWWGDIGAGMRECQRVLRPGGRIVVIAEFYNGGSHAKYAGKLAMFTSMAVMDAEQHRAMLSDAGFADVQLLEEPRRGWIRVVGTKR